MPKRAPASVSDAQVEELAAALWQHRDDLVRLATELPAALASASSQLRDAGAGAQRAGKYLSGDVKKFAGHAADVLEESKHQLLAVLHALEGAGKMLRNMPLIGDMGKAMSEHLGAIGDVAENLDVVGKKVRRLGNRLADVGADLGSMGKSLVGSAESLGTVTTATKSSEKPTSKTPASKKPAGKQQSGAKQAATLAAKKPAVKKATAKKTAAAATSQQVTASAGAKKQAAPKNAAAKKASARR